MTERRTARRFDLVEVLVLGLAVVIVSRTLTLRFPPKVIVDAVQLGGSGSEERAPLERQYGPGHNSIFGEEWIVRDFFQDRPNGVFLDVGANDYRETNNTYYLETALRWSGVAIDAQAEYAPGYAAHRPRTRFFTLFVSDVSDATASLYIPTDHPLNASAREDSIVHTGPTETRRVPTITLNDLLAREHLDHVDFVSMDIELWEPKALAGFDVERYRPSLVCIEGAYPVRQAIIDYFYQHHYVIVGKYLRADSINLYFSPAR